MLKEIPKEIIPDGSVEMESMEWAGQREMRRSLQCVVSHGHVYLWSFFSRAVNFRELNPYLFAMKKTVGPDGFPVIFIL